MIAIIEKLAGSELRSPATAAPSSVRTLIAVSIGDPAGIGPEVCLKASDSGVADDVCDHFLVGDFELLSRLADQFKISRPLRRIDDPAAAVGARGSINVLHPEGSEYPSVAIGKPSALAGNASLACLTFARSLGDRGLIDGLVEGPVDSSSLALTGKISDPDEIQPAGSFLLRMAGNLRNVSLSEHIRIRDVPATVTRESVLSLIRLIDGTLRRWGFDDPKIAVAALNPHGFYEEDKEEIAPAVADAQAEGILAEGPLSPDSVFRRCVDGAYDAVVSMYHDQGQIALKTAAIAGARTVMINLPYVHVVVPHGSAYDIAGRGVANPSSLQEALKTAGLLAGARAEELATLA